MWHRGTKRVSIYLALVAIASMPLVVAPGKLSGIYLIAVTLPWSGIAGVVLDATNPNVFDSAYVGYGICFVSAVLNSVIIFWWSGRARPSDTVPKSHVGDEWKQ